MRAMAIDSFGGLELLKAMDVPRPRPEKGEVLIRIVAAGLEFHCLWPSWTSMREADWHSWGEGE